MRTILFAIGALAVAGIVAASPLAASGKWKVVKQSDGITISTRPVEGSPVDEFRGVTTINARIEVIGEVLRDVPANVEWMADCKEARVISRKDKDNLVIYFVQGAPGPVSNRDFIVRVNTTKNYDKGVVIVNLKAIAEPLVPVNPKYIRITDLTGQYILQYIDRERTKVIYTVRANPGGSLPTWIANYASKDTPFKTLAGLRRQSAKAKYVELGNNSEDKKKIEERLKKGGLK
ncbi:MAG TPA: START domain-containing protein [Spirochaetota bacterium]|nr:START domain-containing protein [Spirochaetota bacterium]HNT09955.1 START domain-containing protein [Spirochaetota bacterium]HNV45713.1 START domain-containing protein [Spirochaetota bacterium]HOS38396.1 START domain-containing protein [Spirochaetota bacterium]HPU87781.1 START domain-containing protein [Spirochaetota bacterium]